MPAELFGPLNVGLLASSYFSRMSTVIPLTVKIGETANHRMASTATGEDVEKRYGKRTGNILYCTRNIVGKFGFKSMKQMVISECGSRLIKKSFEPRV